MTDSVTEAVTSAPAGEPGVLAARGKDALETRPKIPADAAGGTPVMTVVQEANEQVPTVSQITVTKRVTQATSPASVEPKITDEVVVQEMAEEAATARQEIPLQIPEPSAAGSDKVSTTVQAEEMAEPTVEVDAAEVEVVDMEEVSEVAVEDVNMPQEVVHQVQLAAVETISEAKEGVHKEQEAPKAEVKDIAPTKMAEPGDKPALAGEPATKVEEPTTEGKEPATEVTESTAEIKKSATDVKEPAKEAKESATEVTEPATKVTEPATEVKESMTEVDKPATEVEDSTGEVKVPATQVTESATEVTEPATETSATEVTEPVTEVTEPEKEVTEPVTEAEAVTVSDEPITEDGKEPEKTTEVAEETAPTAEEDKDKKAPIAANTEWTEEQVKEWSQQGYLPMVNNMFLPSTMPVLPSPLFYIGVGGLASLVFYLTESPIMALMTLVFVLVLILLARLFYLYRLHGQCAAESANKKKSE